MGRMRCKCGNVICDVESPSPDLFLAIPDEKMWSVVKQAVAACGDEHPADAVSAAIILASVAVYRCSECGRLLVFWDGSDAQYSSYSLEQKSNAVTNDASEST